MNNLIKKAKLKISSLLEKKVEIPSYEEKRAIIDFYRKKFKTKILVETGTFLGDTVSYFKDKFVHVYSIELSKELAEKAVKRFEGQSNITILQGDSGEVLNTLLTKFNEPVLFWLDGHYSSEFFLNGEFIKTARAEKDTPIEKELDLLLSSTSQHIILIDDARLFNGNGDYPSIKRIKNKTDSSKFPYQTFVEKDIIIIIPK